MEQKQSRAKIAIKNLDPNFMRSRASEAEEEWAALFFMFMPLYYKPNQSSLQFSDLENT